MLQSISKQELINFEREVADAFEAGLIKGPIHLSGGNENVLINLFQDIKSTDWVFSTWRNHYHALLHGIPREEVMRQIMTGRGMNLNDAKHKFFTSAIVGGTCPIAVGVAAAIQRRNATDHVWCFVGDMVASMGIFQDTLKMAAGLPITFIIEDNGLCANSPTDDCWPNTKHSLPDIIQYKYERQYPHTGIGKWVTI